MASLTIPRGFLAAALAFALCQSSGNLAQASQSAPDNGGLANPGRIAFQHDGKNVNGFALYLQPGNGGSAIRIDLGLLKPDAKGLISAKLPKIPAGVYRAEVAAYNGAGESPRVAADPPVFTVTGQDAQHVEHGTVHPEEARVADQGTKTPADTGRKTDSGAKKDGAGKRFWKVLVGDDDKP